MKAQYDIYTTDGTYLQTVPTMAEARAQARYYFEYNAHNENYPDIVIRRDGREVKQFHMCDFPKIWNW